MTKPTKIKQGDKFGKLTVVDRGPDFEGSCGDKRVRWWVDCSVCDKMFLKISRDIERNKTIKCKHCEYKWEKKSE